MNIHSLLFELIVLTDRQMNQAPSNARQRQPPGQVCQLGFINSTVEGGAQKKRATVSQKRRHTFHKVV